MMKKVKINISKTNLHKDMFSNKDMEYTHI
jgi:hypothetical protein